MEAQGLVHPDGDYYRPPDQPFPDYRPCHSDGNGSGILAVCTRQSVPAIFLRRDLFPVGLVGGGIPKGAYLSVNVVCPMMAFSQKISTW